MLIPPSIAKEDSFERTILIWSSLHGLASLIIDGFMDIDKIYPALYDKMFEDMLASSVTNKIKLLSTIPFMEGIFKPNI
ncbi:MAG: WHG domain-containing protein [Epsilonproteobacteria bacterium]|nr:WHG domain-containing protein [Campylobacterota bacterium]